MSEENVERNEILLAGTLRDWRVADQCDEELSEEQRKPWSYEIAPGGWDGLALTLVAPDGTKRTVGVEIDQGNVKLVTFRDRDELDAMIVIQADGTHVRSNTASQAYLFDENGSRPAASEPTPSFADPAPGPEA